MDLVHFIFLRVHNATDWEAMTTVDYFLVGFNSIEAMIWFGCAAYVIRRNARSHRSSQERLYGVLFVLFGVTDIVETLQVSSPLIWIKLFVLIPLFVVRRKVIVTYEPRPKLV